MSAGDVDAHPYLSVAARLMALPADAVDAHPSQPHPPFLFYISNIITKITSRIVFFHNFAPC